MAISVRKLQVNTKHMDTSYASDVKEDFESALFTNEEATNNATKNFIESS